MVMVFNQDAHDISFLRTLCHRKAWGLLCARALSLNINLGLGSECGLNCSKHLQMCCLEGPTWWISPGASVCILPFPSPSQSPHTLLWEPASDRCVGGLGRTEVTNWCPWQQRPREEDKRTVTTWFWSVRIKGRGKKYLMFLLQVELHSTEHTTLGMSLELWRFWAIIKMTTEMSKKLSWTRITFWTSWGEMSQAFTCCILIFK